MVSDRLLHLQSEVEAYYEQLSGLEKALRLAPQEGKVRIQQQIRELQTEIRDAEQKYWQRWEAEAAGLTIPEVEAEAVVGELLGEVENLELVPTVQANVKLMESLQAIKAELQKPGTPGSAKLKLAIPLLPGFVSYEIELDTEGLLRRAFPTFRALGDKLKK